MAKCEHRIAKAHHDINIGILELFFPKRQTSNVQTMWSRDLTRCNPTGKRQKSSTNRRRYAFADFYRKVCDQMKSLYGILPVTASVWLLLAFYVNLSMHSRGIYHRRSPDQSGLSSVNFITVFFGPLRYLHRAA